MQINRADHDPSNGDYYLRVISSVVQNRLDGVNLTFQELGALVYLLSQSEELNFKVEYLADRVGLSRRHAQRVLDKLQEKGFVEKESFRNDQGQFETEYIVNELPSDRSRDSHKSTSQKVGSTDSKPRTHTSLDENAENGDSVKSLQSSRSERSDRMTYMSLAQNPLWAVSVNVFTKPPLSGVVSKDICVMWSEELRSQIRTSLEPKNIGSAFLHETGVCGDSVHGHICPRLSPEYEVSLNAMDICVHGHLFINIIPYSYLVRGTNTTTLDSSDLDRLPTSVSSLGFWVETLDANIYRDEFDSEADGKTPDQGSHVSSRGKQSSTAPGKTDGGQSETVDSGENDDSGSGPPEGVREKIREVHRISRLLDQAGETEAGGDGAPEEESEFEFDEERWLSGGGDEEETEREGDDEGGESENEVDISEADDPSDLTIEQIEDRYDVEVPQWAREKAHPKYIEMAASAISANRERVSRLQDEEDRTEPPPNEVDRKRAQSWGIPVEDAKRLRLAAENFYDPHAFDSGNRYSDPGADPWPIRLFEAAYPNVTLTPQQKELLDVRVAQSEPAAPPMWAEAVISGRDKGWEGRYVENFVQLYRHIMGIELQEEFGPPPGGIRQSIGRVRHGNGISEQEAKTLDRPKNFEGDEPPPRMSHSLPEEKKLSEEEAEKTRRAPRLSIREDHKPEDLPGDGQVGE